MLTPGLLLALAALAGALPGCARLPLASRPAILLLVLDTTRADAVSAYGDAAGTTPHTDALAAGGLRYTRAYAQAPWTLPSHATLFTGLFPGRHGVGWRRTRAAAALDTLAERLQAAGYETVAISENPWVSDAFNLTQGFERTILTRGFTLGPDAPEEAAEDSETVRALRAWLAVRRGTRPFFLFVNLLDAHSPYLVRRENRFLPPGIDAAEARRVPQDPARYFCATSSQAPELAVLRGLYLGGVAAADAKLGAILDHLRAAGLGAPLLTIVTSDHGEHFGEHGLVGHQFSVREALLRVPLVVHGIAGAAPAVIATPVRLADVMPTVLAAAGLPVPAGLDGEPLPTSAAAAGMRAVVAEHDDSEDAHAGGEAELARLIRRANRAVRRNCTPADPVFGTMRTLIRYPMKLVWYERYPAELYDLAADPAELHDLAGARPELCAELEAELARRVRDAAASAHEGTAEPEATVAPDVAERLRALGYLGTARDGTPSAAASP